MNFFDVGNSQEVFADGIHDDTKALQSCIDKVKNGGTVYFPDGVYLISAALIFYSGQHLMFSDKAVLLRNAKSEPVTKYMLASYSLPENTGYDGTHNVTISGGIFDGNENTTEKLTILNTVHCRDIIIENCRFVHCSMWHCIELNSTKNALVRGCIFEGPSYTAMREDLTSELVQVDAPFDDTYGPVFDCNGTLIDFNRDGTPCCDIEIERCIFRCDGFTAIGHHGNHAHRNLKIHNNIFTGLSGMNNKSRGFITFMEKVSDVHIYENAFISKAESNTEILGISTNNPSASSCFVNSNVFCGHFSKYFTGGITQKDNIFN